MNQEQIKDLNSIKDLMTNSEIKHLPVDNYTPTINSFMQRTFKQNFKKIAFFTIVSVLLSYYLKYRINAFFPNIIELVYNNEYYFGIITILSKSFMIITLWHICILLGYNQYKLENIISSEEDKKQYLQITYRCAYSLNGLRLLMSTFVLGNYSVFFLVFNQNQYQKLWFIFIVNFIINLVQFLTLTINPKRSLSFYYSKYGNYITIINILILFLLVAK